MGVTLCAMCATRTDETGELTDQPTPGEGVEGDGWALCDPCTAAIERRDHDLLSGRMRMLRALFNGPLRA